MKNIIHKIGMILIKFFYCVYFLLCKKKRENKEDFVIDFFPYFLRNFFQREKIIYNSLVIEKNNITMNLVFKKEIPFNLRLKGLIIELYIRMEKKRFYVVKEEVSGNMIILELKSLEKNDRALEKRRLINLERMIISDKNFPLVINF